MLLEIAIGDAYGAGFEFNPAALAYNDLSKYLGHALHATNKVKGLWGLDPGQYTDDTQMSLAIAEALVEGDPWTPVSLAGRFCDVFHRDPRPGYSKGFFDFLMAHTDGESFLHDIKPGSNRCGAAMRACPIGLHPLEYEVMRMADVQAAITHNSPEGRTSAVVVAMAVHYAYYRKGPMKDLGWWLNSHPLVHLNEVDWGVWQGRPGVRGTEVVQAAIAVVTKNTTLCDTLRAAVAFGGDTDSVAAIAMGIASVSHEHVNDLPDHLRLGLERGRFGFDYLLKMDLALEEWAAARMN